MEPFTYLFHRGFLHEDTKHKHKMTVVAWPDGVPKSLHLTCQNRTQLDAHPARGAWNREQLRHLAVATEHAPLAFLDMIEDAARVLPPAAREKLPRCLCVRTTENCNIFARPPPEARLAGSWSRSLSR